MSAVRILIADDHAAVRRWVRSILKTRSDIELCAEAVDGIDAVEKGKAFKPDVVILDISLPRLGGLEAVPLIRRELPRRKFSFSASMIPRVPCRSRGAWARKVSWTSAI